VECRRFQAQLRAVEDRVGKLAELIWLGPATVRGRDAQLLARSATRHAAAIPSRFCIGVVREPSAGLRALDTAPSERHQPHRPARPRLPLRPGDAAIRRRRLGGRARPLAANSGIASTTAAASLASPGLLPSDSSSRAITDGGWLLRCLGGRWDWSVSPGCRGVRSAVRRSACPERSNVRGAAAERVHRSSAAVTPWMVSIP
jgi:hypothetical protein